MRRFSAGVLAIVAACIGAHYLCVVPFRDNLTMRDLDERTENALSADPNRAVLLARANLADLKRIARSLELDPAWYLLYGANCELLDRWQDAADSYTRAMAIDQRPEIYFRRGLALLHLGRIEAATADLTTAVRFNPTFIDQIDGELHASVAAAAGLP
jgi:tetratricopeptide (TPR) repeat protein